MKIAVSSDWHGRKPLSKDRKVIESCNMLLLCGDIFEQHYHNEKIINYFKCLHEKGIKVVMTPGNHDWQIYRGELTRHQLLSEYGIELLVDNWIIINGISIYGTPWSPEFCNWAYMRSEEDLKLLFDHIPIHLDILLSHTPPMDLNSKIDSCIPKLYYTQPDHIGSSAMYDAIVRKQPRYAFCGHIHSGDHNEVNIGNTRCYNVSYVGENYEPTYDIKVIEIKGADEQ